MGALINKSLCCVIILGPHKNLGPGLAWGWNSTAHESVITFKVQDDEPDTE